MSRCRRRRRRTRAERYASPIEFSWTVTFSDLLTLLLTFFVLRISASSLSTEALARVRIDQTPHRAGALFERLTREIADSTAEDGESELVSIEAVPGGVKMSLRGEGFRPASVQLSARARELVRSTVDAAKLVRTIEISGHTDDVPIATERFASNWELSAGRAISVAEIYLEAGVAGEKLSAVGYADTRPRASNSEEQGRARNRRVEILFVP
ncbi:MAG: OmpA family protein [Bdellovibrionales bacterium]|nr:OmpA family protein [Bdellovibrionales bacterium]